MKSIKYLVGIVLTSLVAVFLIACSSSRPPAQIQPSGTLSAKHSQSSAASEDECWDWVLMPNSGSKVALTLSTTKDGDILKWPNPKGEFVIVQIHKTKGPPAATSSEEERIRWENRDRHISVCNRDFKSIIFLKDSISLQYLQTASFGKRGTEDVKLQPGYYAVRVIVGDTRGPSSGLLINCNVAECSNWVVIQVK